MSHDDKEIYIYKRGDKYSVTVVVKGGEIAYYADQKSPQDADPDVVLEFIEEAETAVEKKIKEKQEVQNGGTSS